MVSVIKCYFCPFELTPADQLTDGPNGVPFRIVADTLLVWIDLHPGAKFTHPTTYVLISATETQVVDGEWWPVVNGKPILYGSHNLAAILSPFELERPRPENNPA